MLLFAFHIHPQDCVAEKEAVWPHFGTHPALGETEWLLLRSVQLCPFFEQRQRQLTTKLTKHQRFVLHLEFIIVDNFGLQPHSVCFAFSDTLFVQRGIITLVGTHQHLWMSLPAFHPNIQQCLEPNHTPSDDTVKSTKRVSCQSCWLHSPTATSCDKEAGCTPGSGSCAIPMESSGNDQWPAVTIHILNKSLMTCDHKIQGIFKTPRGSPEDAQQLSQCATPRLRIPCKTLEVFWRILLKVLRKSLSVLQKTLECEIGP